MQAPIKIIQTKSLRPQSTELQKKDPVPPMQRNRATARNVGRSNCLYPLLLNAVTACTHYCGAQSLLVPVNVECSHCLCPLQLNAITASARYCWTHLLPGPLLLNAVTASARCCWTHLLSGPLLLNSVERLNCARYR